MEKASTQTEQRAGAGTRTQRAPAVRGIALLLAFLLGICLISKLCLFVLATPDGVSRILLHDAYTDEQPDTFTVFGASEPMYAFDPERFDAAMGTRSRILSGSAIILNAGVLAIFEDYLDWCEKNHRLPQTMALMIGQSEMYAYKGGESPTSYALLAPYLNSQTVRFQYWLRAGDVDGRWFERVFYWKDLLNWKPRTNIRARLSEDYNNYVFHPDGREHKGRGYMYRDPDNPANQDQTPVNGITLTKLDPENLPTPEWENTNTRSVDALRRMAGICRKKGIRFLVLEAPIPYYAAYTTDYIRNHETLEQLADEEQFEYYDLNLLKQEYYDPPKDGFFDRSHTNGLGGEVYTDVLAKFLQTQAQTDTQAHTDTQAQPDAASETDHGDYAGQDSSAEAWFESWPDWIARVEAYYQDNPAVVIANP